MYAMERQGEERAVQGRGETKKNLRIQQQHGVIMSSARGHKNSTTCGDLEEAGDLS